MMARRVWFTGVAAVTVDLTLVLVVPSRLTSTMSLVVVRARRLAVAAVASHACVPPSVSVIVNTLAKSIVLRSPSYEIIGAYNFG